MLTIEPHPLLDLRAFITTFPGPLGSLPASPQLHRLLAQDATAPLASSDSIRRAVRDLLRHGGFKPTGRSKPASEYLLKAAAEGVLASINRAVDACNVVSLHSGLPISVVDLDKCRPHAPREEFFTRSVKTTLCVRIAAEGLSYVFNLSGQTIDIGGLVCLFDGDGPCASPVKDSQRTKTGAETTRTLSLIWGTHALPSRTEETETWYRQLLREQGAQTE